MNNNSQRLQDLAQFVVREAGRLGATDCDVRIEGDESVETSIRLGEVEELKGAQGRGLTFRAFVGKKSASTSTSDFRRRQLTKLVRDTIAMAKLSEADEFAGLPDDQDLAKSVPDLGLFDGEAGKLSAEAKLELAIAAEKAAMAADPRITNSEGSGFSDHTSTIVYANSRGFVGSFSASSCSLGLAVVASEGEDMQVGYWTSSSRKLSGLAGAEAVGRKAAERALRMLGGKKVPSCKVPVIFDNLMAGQLLGQFAGAAVGASIYRRSSFLVGKLGQKVAISGLQIICDPFITGGMGSRPFGSEGLAVRKREIVKDGVLAEYFLDGYSARKLGCRPNGGGPTNLYIPAGDKSLAEMIASVKSGLYLTSVSGPGFNQVTGDYSRGASGIWIEDGKLTHAVREITVAGNVLDMLQNITAIGNDLEFRSSVNSPSLMIGEMMIAGS